jgi:hypothetical protein
MTGAALPFALCSTRAASQRHALHALPASGTRFMLRIACCAMEAQRTLAWSILRVWIDTYLLIQICLLPWPARNAAWLQRCRAWRLGLFWRHECGTARVRHGDFAAGLRHAVAALPLR